MIILKYNNINLDNFKIILIYFLYKYILDIDINIKIIYINNKFNGYNNI